MTFIEIKKHTQKIIQRKIKNKQEFSVLAIYLYHWPVLCRCGKAQYRNVSEGKFIHLFKTKLLNNNTCV